MTVPTPENMIEPTLPQDKVEANIAPDKLDLSLNQQTKAADSETKEDPNWRAFREARKQDRLQRELAEQKAAEKEAEVQALKAAMEAAFSKGSPIANPSYSQNNGYPEEETEDQRIEKKVQAAIAQREAAAERARLEREQQEYPQKLLQVYSDFNHVISNENLDYLDYHYPEVAGPLKRQADGFEKWSDIYKAIKRFIPNTNAKKDAAKAEANFARPKSISSTGLTQTAETMGTARLTEERKMANWERMQRMLKGLT